MKNIIEEINNRLNDSEEWISKMEDRVVKATATTRKKRKKNERKWGQSKRLWDYVEHMNIQIIGVPERE